MLIWFLSVYDSQEAAIVQILNNILFKTFSARLQCFLHCGKKSPSTHQGSQGNTKDCCTWLKANTQTDFHSGLCVHPWMCPSTLITSAPAKWLFMYLAAFHTTITVLLWNKRFRFQLTLSLPSQQQPPLQFRADCFNYGIIHINNLQSGCLSWWTVAGLKMVHLNYTVSQFDPLTASEPRAVYH